MGQTLLIIQTERNYICFIFIEQGPQLPHWKSFSNIADTIDCFWVSYKIVQKQAKKPLSVSSKVRFRANWIV